jgi:Xaa-Pro aminopeptidase
MAEAGVDMLVGATRENAFYLTAFHSFSPWLIGNRTTPVYGVASADAEVSLLAPAYELDRAASDRPPVDRIVGFETQMIESGDESKWVDEDRLLHELALSEGRPESALDALESVIPRGLRVAVDDADLAQTLRERLDADTVAAGSLFEEIRRIKTPEEVRRLRRAVEITESAITRGIEAAREGISEFELGVVVEQEIIAGGARPYFSIIGTGTFGAYLSHAPGQQRVRRGDLIRWDIGCAYQGYLSDIARTSVVGEASTDQQSRWKAVLAGQLAALELVRPGASVAEIFRVGMEAARASGLPQIRRSSMGHGIGIDLNETPWIADNDAILEPGMVFELEIAMYELGYGGIQVEDTLHVTDSGVEVLTSLPHVLFESNGGS